MNHICMYLPQVIYDSEDKSRSRPSSRRSIMNDSHSLLISLMYTSITKYIA